MEGWEEDLQWKLDVWDEEFVETCEEQNWDMSLTSLMS